MELHCCFQREINNSVKWLCDLLIVKFSHLIHTQKNNCFSFRVSLTKARPIIKWFSIPRKCEKKIHEEHVRKRFIILKECLKLSSLTLVTDVKNTKIPLKFNCFKVIIRQKSFLYSRLFCWRKTTDGKFNTHNRCFWEREVKMLNFENIFDIF